MKKPKKSLIKKEYWDKLEEECAKQVKEKGFYRRRAHSDEFKDFTVKPKREEDFDGDVY